LGTIGLWKSSAYIDHIRFEASGASEIGELPESSQSWFNTTLPAAKVELKNRHPYTESPQRNQCRLPIVCINAELVGMSCLVRIDLMPWCEAKADSPMGPHRSRTESMCFRNGIEYDAKMPQGHRSHPSALTGTTHDDPLGAKATFQCK
jgi:hypothetical protein